MPTYETGWFSGKLGPSRQHYLDLVEVENSGSHQTKRYDSSFLMNFGSTHLCKSVPDATGGWQSTNCWLCNKHYYVCTAAQRTKRADAIPHALSSDACCLGFVINFFAKPVDALASLAQSLYTPRAGKAMNLAKCQTRCQNESEFSLQYFDNETIIFY